MGFLRRLLGGADAGGDGGDGGESPATGRATDAAATATAALTPDEAERAHELELARFEQARTDDLIRRQQRFADRAWRPPAQGGDRRADDEDGSSGDG